MGLQEDLTKARCKVAGSKAVIAVVQAQLVIPLHWRCVMCMQPVSDPCMHAEKKTFMTVLALPKCSQRGIFDRPGLLKSLSSDQTFSQ